MLGCDYTLSQVSYLAGELVGVISSASQASGHGGGPGLAFPCPPPSAPTCSGLDSLGTQSYLSLGQTTGVRSLVGLAMRGAGSCQSLLSPLSGRALEDSVNVAAPREMQREAGQSERGMPGPTFWPPDAPGSGETRVRLSELTHLPRAPPPPAPSQASHTTGLCEAPG